MDRDSLQKLKYGMISIMIRSPSAGIIYLGIIVGWGLNEVGCFVLACIHINPIRSSRTLEHPVFGVAGRKDDMSTRSSSSS